MDKPPIYIFPKNTEQPKSENSDETLSSTTHITVMGTGNNVVTGSGTQTVGDKASKDTPEKKSSVMKITFVIGGIATFLASLAGITGYTGKDIMKLFRGEDRTIAPPTVVAKGADTTLVKHIKPLTNAKEMNEPRKQTKRQNKNSSANN